MADDAAEEAFINAMQNQNDASMSGVAGTVSQQQADSASDDEYDPAQAMQADTLITDAQDISVPSPSVPVMHEALPTSAPLATAPSSANNAFQDQSDNNTFNQSRSMSPESSQSFQGENASAPGNQSLPSVPRLDTSTGLHDAGTDVLANGDNLEQASHTAPSTIPDSTSTPNVPLHNDVQNRTSADIAQNGVDPSDSAAAPYFTDSTATAQGNAKVQSQMVPPAAQAQETTASQTATSHAVALPKARLPHDRIGILEDRIKEDPRGDIDAWLSLIDEHRKRGKIDEARNVYERFFGVFPWAVCIHSLVCRICFGCKADYVIGRTMDGLRPDGK